MTRWWTLSATGDPEPAESGVELLRWLCGRNTTIAEDRIDGVIVSTIFTGVDVAECGPPRLWETRVFCGLPGHSKIVDHYTSRAGALEGHARILAFVRQDLARRGRT